jgi:anthranilate synthase component 2
MILVIDNYDSFVYNLVHYVEVILSPGPCTPSDAGICLELLALAPQTLPMLGVCLGHQAMGQAFGGDVVSAKEIMHGKISNVTHAGGGLFRGLPSPFRATRYHSLAVARDTFPHCLNIDAQTADGEVMGLSHKSRPVFGVQFHPESIASEHGHAIVANFLQAARLL